MRILIVADHFPPTPGGLAIQAERLSERLGQLQHEVVTIAVGPERAHKQRSGHELYLQPTSLGRVPWIYQEGSPMFHPPWPDPTFRRALGSIVRAFAPEIMHVHGWSVFSAASLPQPRPPIVATLHDYGLLCPKKSLMRHRHTCQTGRGIHCISCDSEAQPTPRRTALAAALGVNVPLLARRVQCWLAVSQYVADQHERLPNARHRIRVVPPLIDLPAVRSERPEQPPYILYVGAGDENPDKGRATLLEAFGRAALDGYRLVLVGGRGRVAAPGVEDRGYLKGDELMRAFRGATLAIVPSRWPDPCPAVAVEALAYGVPVIASAVGGLPEIVQSETAGILVPPDDPAALAGALERLVRNTELRESMSRVARQSVERFSTEHVLLQHQRLYEEIVSTATAHPERAAA
jgi:glycosyltransferase involved in cell wall biosynthesis